MISVIPQSPPVPSPGTDLGLGEEGVCVCGGGAGRGPGSCNCILRGTKLEDQKTVWVSKAESLSPPVLLLPLNILLPGPWMETPPLPASKGTVAIPRGWAVPELDLPLCVPRETPGNSIWSIWPLLSFPLTSVKGTERAASENPTLLRWQGAGAVKVGQGSGGACA